ncbi:dihydroorotase family protein [Ferruginibacter sp. HRS2-29]|uniref:dihydroorotase n=1 Tax=Ferruginibacter sp. HRS2-29 TaxID=2487334 RepID=UPI0020CB7FAF|nr:dihydroorotase [Ferruginibacter sp. HRS2-29]MCP9750362.1 dihydroorotase [Ferruginibacter sp. HRS2-29]
MKVLIQQVRIISPSSPFNGKVTDILIENGIIRQIADHISAEGAQVITHPDLHCSIGWMDIFAQFDDPGFEHKETLVSGAAAAAAGGFTDVMLVPNTNPAVSSKIQVEYIRQKAASLPINLYPIGAITKNAEGKELAEMYDMHNSGAIAFSDGIQSLQSPGILLKALQYVLSIGATLLQVPNDKSISAHGLMNEGIMSTRLGLPGIPSIAEELMIARDIELLRYTGSRLHITGVTTQKGIELIAAAKKEGLQVSFSVTPYHAWFCDEDLVSYNTNLKVNPPLRKKEDMLAVRQAIANGTADCIASHHVPQHWDDKECEFEYARNGMIGLESFFGVANRYGAPLETLIEKLTVQPRELFRLEVPSLTAGTAASLTLFAPGEEYTFEKEMIRSTSFNTPFIGQKLKGRVIGIINKQQIVLNHFS